MSGIKIVTTHKDQDPASVVIITDPNSFLFDERALTEPNHSFVDNINALGIQQAVHVWRDPADGKLKALDGRMRLKAGIANNIKRAADNSGPPLTVDLKEVESTNEPEQLMGLMVSLNMQRMDEKPSVLSAKLHRLLALGMARSSLPIITGKTESEVRQHLDLEKLDTAVKAKVALVEGNKLGGDCLNYGCVPSKALIRTAGFVHQARQSRSLGIGKADTEFDFADVMARVHRVIAQIAPHDSAERYTGLGVDVMQGTAKIVSPWEVEIDGKRVSTKAIVIATGAQAVVPPIPGLVDAGFYTSDTLWELKELPKEFIVLGGGPIGCELSQALARLGAEVTQVERGDRILPREDEDAAALGLASLADIR